MPELGDERARALRARALRALDETVVDAAGYLAEVDPDLDGGHQTAREVLCHLVFWHSEYVAISRALQRGQEPPLKVGTYAQLNSAATEALASRSMEELAHSLLLLQEALQQELLALPDWSIDFPVKHGGRCKSVAERLPTIESHVRNHVRRLRRADRLGKGWVKAYYPDQGV